MVNRQNDNGVAADHSPKQQDQTEVTKTTVAETNAVVVKNGDDADKKTDLATLFATQLGIDTTSLKTKMPGKHDGEWTSMEVGLCGEKLSFRFILLVFVPFC